MSLLDFFYFKKKIYPIKSILLKIFIMDSNKIHLHEKSRYFKIKVRIIYNVHEEE